MRYLTKRGNATDYAWKVGVAVGIAACSSAPISYSSTTPKPLDAAYACALSKINELGYTVTNTNKDAGFVQASRHTSSGFSEALSGAKTFDFLTVAIFDAANGGKTLRVTAGSGEQKANMLFGKASETGTAPSKNAKLHASAILASCASGSVTEKVGDALFRVEGLVAP